MISSMYKVKRFHGQFDGESLVAPTVTFDSDSGYYVGFRLLVKDGSDYVCNDSTVGAAVWTKSTEYDNRILAQLQAVSQVVFRFCNSYFIANQPDFWECESGVFNGKSLTDAFAAFDILFYPGDSILITGSRRNDNVYSLDSVSATVMNMLTDFAVDMTDQSGFTIVSVSWPSALSAIGARMVEYDVYRRNESPGLASEGIGSYSASKEETDIIGTGYPNSVIAGIFGFKRPRIAGYPLLDSRYW